MHSAVERCLCQVVLVVAVVVAALAAAVHPAFAASLVRVVSGMGEGSWEGAGDEGAGGRGDGWAGWRLKWAGVEVGLCNGKG